MSELIHKQLMQRMLRGDEVSKVSLHNIMEFILTIQSGQMQNKHPFKINYYI